MLTNNDNCGTPQENLNYESESCYYAQGRDIKNVIGVGVGGFPLVRGKFNDMIGLYNLTPADASIAHSYDTVNRLLQTGVQISASPGNTISLNPDGLYSAGGGGPAFQFPIGYVYISVDGTDPNTVLGYGVWQQFAEGRVLVGVDVTDPDFDTVEEIGGEKKHVLTCPEVPDCADDVEDPYDDLFLLMGA